MMKPSTLAHQVSDFRQLKGGRQERMLEFIEGNVQATVSELSSQFRVSDATVRRDLEELSQEGRLRRTHGGALRAIVAPHILPTLERAKDQQAAKRAIAQATVNLLRDGQTIFLGAGSTTAEVARELVGRKELTVISNALNVANALAADPGTRLVLLGGQFRREELSLIGPFTEQGLSDLHVDVLIMGALAFHPEMGLTNEYLPEMMTNRRIIQSADRVFLVADHTKLGRVSTVLLAPVTSFHTLITDDGASVPLIEAFRKQGLTVVIA